MGTITTHGDHLVQVLRLGFCNAWLVREDDGITLIDTTMGASAGAEIVAAAVDTGWGPIRRVLLTHAHMDHAGGLDGVAPLLDPATEIAITARDARFLEGDTTVTPDEGKKRGGFPKTTTRPTRMLEPGETIGSLRVLATPGHTPGHVSFLDERDGTLIAGDVVKTLGGLRASGDFDWRFPLPWLATCDRERSIATAHGLVDLAITRIAPGHGRLLTEAASAMRAAL